MSIIFSIPVNVTPKFVAGLFTQSLTKLVILILIYIPTSASVTFVEYIVGFIAGALFHVTVASEKSLAFVNTLTVCGDKTASGKSFLKTNKFKEAFVIVLPDGTDPVKSNFNKLLNRSLG
ncbi:hypothetical protein CLBEJ_36030 [Clostridium beijerinckii]|nr:hypothetical protein CLBEJ_36030 [Clostridium beijerinckii]OOM36726.1 hypothetical protein CLOBJ_36490 [Clostridium beijerinckii]